jgi:hypothetical protein
MSIEDCIEKYQELGLKVFDDPKGPFGKSKYDYKKLETVIKRVVKDKLGDEDALLFDETCCKT